jgi:hypothetical protein
LAFLEFRPKFINQPEIKKVTLGSLGTQDRKTIGEALEP